jgi:hypothetical protein
MVMVMVVVIAIIATISGYHDDARPIPLITISPVGAVMVVVMMVIILRQLDIFIGRRSGPGFIDGLQQRRGIRNRLKQIGE